MESLHSYAVIMAGGQGTRLWPLSRKSKPKQLQPIASEKTLIEETYERLLPVFSPEQIFISTIPGFAEDIQAVLPNIPKENYILEPALMGNAAACGLVTTVLNQRNPNSTAFFFPADHAITDQKKFIETITAAQKLIEKYPEKIFTIGITVDKPNTGLGYIQIDEKLAGEGNLTAYKAKRFVEKPDLETAKQYLDSGEYFGNAGIFLWRTDFMLSLFGAHLPEMRKILDKIGSAIDQPNEKEVLKNEYIKVENTSIDFGIMEKTREIVVIPADFGWSDVGTWSSLHEMLSNLKGVNNISRGHHIGVNTENCLVYAKDKLIATVGLKNVTVIDTDDAILICDNSQSDKVKALLDKLKEEGKEKYL